MQQPTTAITEYEPIAAALASIEKYRGVIFDVTTEKGMREAKAAHREVAAPRIALEKARTKLKADVLERGRLIDGEAKHIAAQFAAIEDPIVDQIKAEERREQEAREAAIRAEQERLAREEAARKAAEERRLTEERARVEAEQKRLSEERQRFEAEQRAVRERAEAEERARRARLQAEEDARRKVLAEEEERARTARRAEEERLAAEREAIDKARREKEEAERKTRAEQEERERQARLAQERQEREAREALEAVEHEARRKEQELLDARGMLEVFVKRYGHLPEFDFVVVAIRSYFDKQRKAA